MFKLMLVITVLLPVALALPLMFTTSNGETLIGAVIEVEKLDGTRYTYHLGPEGVITVPEVPLGILKVKVISWKDIPIGYQCVATPQNYTVKVPGIHRLIVNVKGSRGQSLHGAAVTVFHQGRSVEVGVSDESGVYKTLLPAASYTIAAEYGGSKREVQVDLVSPQEVTIQLDIFGEIGGLPLSSNEFMGIILLAIVIPLAIFVIAYEYAQWRRRRLLRVVATPPVEK